MPQFFVNHTLTINAKNIDVVNKFGDEYIVLKDAQPLVDEIVMNDGLYPRVENQKAYKSMDKVPVPYGHPQIEDSYISAYDPYAINFNVGAHAENVRNKGDVYLVDIMINKHFASKSERGQELLTRIENSKTTGEPIQISTGLSLNKIEKSGESKGKKYSWIATNMKFDHIAILDENTPAAGQPDEGVGIFPNHFMVNGQKLDVIKPSKEEEVKDDEVSILNKILNLISTKQPIINQEDSKMNAEEMKAVILSAVNEANKPLQEKINALEAQLQANADAEYKPMREEVAKAYQTMTIDQVNSLPIDALKAMHATIKQAATVNTDVQVNNDKIENDVSFDINKLMETK